MSQVPVDVLPSNQTVREEELVAGLRGLRVPAPAERRAQGTRSWEPEAFPILSGEALYRMDYQDMLKTHNETGADITIGVSKQRLGDVDATNLEHLQRVHG